MNTIRIKQDGLGNETKVTISTRYSTRISTTSKVARANSAGPFRLYFYVCRVCEDNLLLLSRDGNSAFRLVDLDSCNQTGIASIMPYLLISYR